MQHKTDQFVSGLICKRRGRADAKQLDAAKLVDVDGVAVNHHANENRFRSLDRRRQERRSRRNEHSEDRTQKRHRNLLGQSVTRTTHADCNAFATLRRLRH